MAFFTYVLLLAWTLSRHNPDERLITLVYGLTVWTSVLLMEWPLQALEQMTYIGVSRVLAAFLYLGCIFMFIHTAENFTRVPWILIFSQTISIFFLWSIFKKRTRKTQRLMGCHPSKIARRYFPDRPFGYSLDGFTEYGHHSFRNACEQTQKWGYYSSAYRILLIATGIVGGLSNAVFPSIAYYWQADQAS